MCDARTGGNDPASRGARASPRSDELPSMRGSRGRGASTTPPPTTISHGAAASALVDVAQVTDAYRTFVDHRWVYLQPGETRSIRLEVESKATSIWDAIERHYPEGSVWLRTRFPAAGCLARTGSGVTLAAVTVVHSSLELPEQGPGFLLVQVAGPGGVTPPRSVRPRPCHSAACRATRGATTAAIPACRRG